MSEKIDEAREKLRDSVDVLADRTNVQLQMQKEPIKLLGGATAVGLVIGILVGHNFQKTKKVYVHADSSPKDQKALAKVQTKKSDKGIGNALLATVVTLGFKVLQDQVLKPKLEEMANSMLDKNRERKSAHKSAGSGSSEGAAPQSALPHSVPTQDSSSSALDWSKS